MPRCPGHSFHPCHPRASLRPPESAVKMPLLSVILMPNKMTNLTNLDLREICCLKWTDARFPKAQTFKSASQYPKMQERLWVEAFAADFVSGAGSIHAYHRHLSCHFDTSSTQADNPAAFAAKAAHPCLPSESQSCHCKSQGQSPESTAASFRTNTSC